MSTGKGIERTGMWIGVLFIIGILCGIIYISPNTAHLWSFSPASFWDEMASFLAAPVSSLKVIHLILLIAIIGFITKR